MNSEKARVSGKLGCLSDNLDWQTSISKNKNNPFRLIVAVFSYFSLRLFKILTVGDASVSIYRRVSSILVPILGGGSLGLDNVCCTH